MSRVYHALAIGDLIAGGTVDAPIGRHPVDRKRMAVVASGRPAVTHYRVLERLPGITLLEVSLDSFHDSLLFRRWRWRLSSSRSVR